MFECKACLAKDAEIAWLRRQLQETFDRFSSLTGTLTQVQDGRSMEVEESELAPPSNDEPQEQTDEASRADAELEKKAMQIRRVTGAQIRPDF